MNSQRSSSEALDLADGGRGEKSVRRMVEILRKHPRHIDALHHLALAYEKQGREAEYRALEREAARVALGALPKGFNWRNSRIVYGELGNRPFFRACHGLSLLMQAEGDEEGARQMWRKLLALNPNDNLGCRILLMDSLVQSKEWKKALSHAERHGDGGVWMAYGRALAHAGLGQHEETLNCSRPGRRLAAHRSGGEHALRSAQSTLKITGSGATQTTTSTGKRTATLGRDPKQNPRASC